MGDSPTHAPSRPSPSRWLVIGAFASLYFFWGSTYLGIKWAVLGAVEDDPGHGFPAFFLAGIRSLIAGAIVYAYMRLARGEARPTARQWRNTTIIGTLLLLGGNGLVTFAVQYIASGIVALLIAMLPIWMLLLEGVWGGPPLRERARPSSFIGIALGFGGLAMLMWPKITAAMDGGRDGGGRDHVMEAVGVAAVMLSSFLWANGSLFARRMAGGGKGGLPASPFVTTGMQLLCGGAALLIVSAATGEWSKVTAAAAFGSPRPALSLAYLIVFGSLVGYTSYIWLLGVSTPAKIATYAYVNPIVAIAIGSAIGKEPLTGRTMLAAAAVIAGVVVIVSVRGKKAGVVVAEEMVPLPEGGEMAK